MNLAEVTERLHNSYRAWKDSEKKKNADKEAFFDLATLEVNENETLAQKTVIVPQQFAGDPRGYVKRSYPEWEILSVELDQEGTTKAVIEENPKFKPFQYINKDAGVVFSRTIKKGQVTIDDETLQAEEPDLWEEITEEVRVPKELDELTPAQIARLQPYLFRKAPSLTLNAPRKATAEELAEV